MIFMNFFGENFRYPFPVNSDFQPAKAAVPSLTLKDDEQQFNNIAYMEEYGDYPEKDSLGRMEFVVVGADQKNRPIGANRIQSSNQPINNAIYRIVYNTTIDSTYLSR